VLLKASGTRDRRDQGVWKGFQGRLYGGRAEGVVRAASRTIRASCYSSVEAAFDCRTSYGIYERECEREMDPQLFAKTYHVLIIVRCGVTVHLGKKRASKRDLRSTLLPVRVFHLAGVGLCAPQGSPGLPSLHFSYRMANASKCSVSLAHQAHCRTFQWHVSFNSRALPTPS